MGILSITDQVRPPRQPRRALNASGGAATRVRGCAAYRAPHRAGPPPQAAGPPTGPHLLPGPARPPATLQRRDPRSERGGRGCRAVRRSAAGAELGGGEEVDRLRGRPRRGPRGPQVWGRPRCPRRRPHVALSRFPALPRAAPRAVRARPAEGAPAVPAGSAPGPARRLRPSRSIAAAGGEGMAGGDDGRPAAVEAELVISAATGTSLVPRGWRWVCRPAPNTARGGGAVRHRLPPVFVLFLWGFFFSRRTEGC